MIRAYCRDHVAEMGFSTKDYRPPTNAGECDVTLSMKEWGHRKDLICYLDTEDGEKLALCVEFSINSERCYRPPSCRLDLSYVQLESRLHIKFDRAQILDAVLSNDVPFSKRAPPFH